MRYLKGRAKKRWSCRAKARVRLDWFVTDDDELGVAADGDRTGLQSQGSK